MTFRFGLPAARSVRMTLADSPEESNASAAGFTIFYSVSSCTIKHLSLADMAHLNDSLRDVLAPSYHNNTMSDTTAGRESSRFPTFWQDFHAACLEFVGTTFFLASAFGGVQAIAAEANAGGGGSLVDRDMKISLCFGFSLLVAAWLFFRVTGGLFNPQVSLALLLCGIIGPVRFVLYCIAQLAGGIAAAGLVLALTPGPLLCK